jgi:perosamine synthetase
MIPHSRPAIGEAETAAVDAVMKSGMLLGGKEVDGFRTDLGGIAGRNEVALFASGRMAIRAALATLNLPGGSGVVVQTYVCDAVVWAIRENGLRPVFCDIGEGWTATPETVAAAWTPDCRALILAPPFGLRQSAREFGHVAGPIIHDLCQASPMVLADAGAGDIASLATLSFHPTKYVCAGGGGALLGAAESGDAARAEAAPLSEMNAAMGRVQLGRLGEFRQRRGTIAALYFEAARGMADRLRANSDVAPGDLFRMPLQSGRRSFDEVAAIFAAEGVIARHGVDQLAHRIAGEPDAAYPSATARFGQTFSPPFYPALSDDDAGRVARVLERLS